MSIAKGAYAVGIHSLLILAWRQGIGPAHDSVFLGDLRRDARRYTRPRHWIMLSDAGFDGKDVRPTDLIPPIRRGDNIVDPDRKARPIWSMLPASMACSDNAGSPRPSCR